MATKLKLHSHPTLNATSKANPGLYRSHKPNKNVMSNTSYITIGDKYNDSILKKSNHRSAYAGKQLITNPPKNTSGGVGFFTRSTYTSDNYSDKTTYLKTQPVDNRRLGFGTHDAARRDEFTTHIRTEQYREQLKFEALTKPAGGGEEGEAPAPRTFPKGLKECKHLYDIGRNIETEFDPKSSRDTFYNRLMCKSRDRAPMRTGGYYRSSADIGAGVEELDHGDCKPQFGHHKATKAFFDNSHLGQSSIG